MNSRTKCAIEGWKVGDLLEGRDGENGPVGVIRITALSETLVIAKEVARNGQPVDSQESVWDLQWREWKKIGRSILELPVRNFEDAERRFMGDLHKTLDRSEDLKMTHQMTAETDGIQFIRIAIQLVYTGPRASAE